MTLEQVRITVGDRDPITLSPKEWARASARTGITYPDTTVFEDAEFVPAEDVERMADLLIGEYEELAHVAGLTICCLWKAEGGKVDGGLKYSECKRTSGLLKHYSAADFVIWLAADNCLKAAFGPRELEALLYHELAHIDIDEKGKPGIRKPDFSGYLSEVERYGLWRRDLVAAGEAIRQLKLEGVAA